MSRARIPISGLTLLQTEGKASIVGLDYRTSRGITKSPDYLRRGKHLIYRATQPIAWLCCILGFVNTSTIRAHGQRYFQIAADIETFSYKLSNLRDGKDPIRYAFSVLCIGGTNCWRIDISESSGKQLWYFDGTNLYDNMIIGKGSSEPNGRKPSNIGSAGLPFPATGTNASEVKSGVHVWPSIDGCPLDGQRVNISWLAFCSGNYLKRQGRLIPLPVVDLRHSPDGFAYSDKTETFQDELGLPRTLEPV